VGLTTARGVSPFFARVHARVLKMVLKEVLSARVMKKNDKNK
jgi:hypothetical protein